MKTGTIKLLGGLAIAYILFSSFKKKGTLTGDVKVLDYQDNVPSGTTQVFSKEGTQVYDNNGSIIYTYNTAGIGMTMTGTKGTEMYSVVIGQSFMNGIPGFVFKYDVQNA
jgi:hypothetical protein